MISFVVIILLSYLLGSIPTSIWVGKLTQKVDIREHGSGNAGATNTFRILGWKAGSTVAAFDLFKGFAAAFYISQLGYIIGDVPLMVGPWETDVFMRLIAGISAVLGHMFPLYAKFKGGKGAITAAGMLFGIEPISIGIVCAVFLIVLFTTRYVSVASMIASFLYPITLIIMRYGFEIPVDGSLIVLTAIVAIIIIVKHRTNIKRLIEGNENRINSFSPSKGRINEEQVS